ncbi:hypothetical protein AB3464_01435 [Pseudomonas asplenii]
MSQFKRLLVMLSPQIRHTPTRRDIAGPCWISTYFDDVTTFALMSDGERLLADNRQWLADEAEQLGRDIRLPLPRQITAAVDLNALFIHCALGAPAFRRGCGDKWILATLMLFACSTGSAQPITQPFVVQVQKTADTMLCVTYKGNHSAFGNAMNKQCRDRARAEFDSLPDEKSLKDCIKPGNVIDDDVRKCMKGL